MQADLILIALLCAAQGLVSAGLIALGQPVLGAAAFGVLVLLLSPVCASCLRGITARD